MLVNELLVGYFYALYARMTKLTGRDFVDRWVLNNGSKVWNTELMEDFVLKALHHAHEEHPTMYVESIWNKLALIKELRWSGIAEDFPESKHMVEDIMYFLGYDKITDENQHIMFLKVALDIHDKKISWERIEGEEHGHFIRINAVEVPRSEYIKE